MLADFDFRPEFFELCLSFFSCDNADRADCAASFFLDVDDFESLFGSDQCGKVSVFRHGCLRCRDENPLREGIDDYAALDGFGDLALQNRSRFFGFENFGPVVVCVDFLFGKRCDSVDIADAHGDGFHLVADLEHIFQLCLRVFRHVFQREDAGYFRADIDVDFGSGNRSNDAADGVSCI